jgi:hypothetical protein
MNIKVGDKFFTEENCHPVSIVAVGLNSSDRVLGIVTESFRDWIWRGNENGSYSGTSTTNYDLISKKEWMARNSDEWVLFDETDDDTIPLDGTDFMVYGCYKQMDYLIYSGVPRTDNEIKTFFIEEGIVGWKYVQLPKD